MEDLQQFVKIVFERFKALEYFTLNIRQFNILVGPNNAGKSTILTAFRILDAGLRRASAKSPQIIRGPSGDTYGYTIDLSAMSVGGENIFYNYDDSEAAKITFHLSGKNELILYFPEKGSCYLIANQSGSHPKSPSAFRSAFNCSIGFVPILGPVEEDEPLYEKEAARRALFNYQAARNFRNIWHHYPDKFEDFSRILSDTWPGMDINKPEIDFSYTRPRLRMFCPEERIPREIFWAGFGFQVWCQMLTHLVQSNDKSIFLIDEPDIYLHSDLQRQLLRLLRNLGPDILVATHSTEIISDAEPDEIVLINKKHRSAKRIKDPTQLGEVFATLGSNLNPILTQLAKTKKALFVEGKDFQIISKIAQKLGARYTGSKSHFAVIPVEGFNPERIRSIKIGIETTLGSNIKIAAILDKDYRSDEECNSITKSCEKFCNKIVIHHRKEIENFLLVPSAIDRAILRKMQDRSKRNGMNHIVEIESVKIFEEFFTLRYSYVMAQTIAKSGKFGRTASSKNDDATLNEKAIEKFNAKWEDLNSKLRIIPGKEALSYVNRRVQEICGVNVTQTSIIEAMLASEICDDMKVLINDLEKFAKDIV